MSQSYRVLLTRREALQLMGVMASSMSVLGCVYPDIEPAPDDAIAWPKLRDTKRAEAGYGTDPNLITPSPAPWPNVLTQNELDRIAELAELLCPGAVNAGVPDVINEWVSAPYPDQEADKALILPGLAWLDSLSFANLSHTQRIALLEPLVQAADQTGPHAIHVAFIGRFRALTTGAYFSSPEGVRELGYVGNRPIAGDYPGANKAAEAHLQALLEQLNLSP